MTTTPNATSQKVPSRVLSLHDDPPREVRRRETARLFEEAAVASPTEREHIVEQIVLLNTGVARAIAGRYTGRGIAREDLEQVAYLALCRAAAKFDGGKAEDFLTYAVPTIRGEIKRHFRDLGWVVRPPRRVQELQAGVVRLRDQSRDSQGRTPDEAEVADELGVSPTDVREALAAEGCFTPWSLDAPATSHRSSDGEMGTTLGELLPAVDDGLEGAETRAMLAPALAELSPRERLIIQLRYEEDLTQAEIGERIGVTQMQVSRLLKTVLAKLREALSDSDRPVPTAA
jgi:RNA polymerase sigma-B factor